MGRTPAAVLATGGLASTPDAAHHAMEGRTRMESCDTDGMIPTAHMEVRLARSLQMPKLPSADGLHVALAPKVWRDLPAHPCVPVPSPTPTTGLQLHPLPLLQPSQLE